MFPDQHVTVAFGNDGYGKRERVTADGPEIPHGFGPGSFYDDIGDLRTRREVELLQRLLAEGGLEEVDFGTSIDGYTWVMFIKGEHVNEVSRMLTAAYKAAFSSEEKEGA